MNAGTTESSSSSSFASSLQGALQQITCLSLLELQSSHHPSALLTSSWTTASKQYIIADLTTVFIYFLFHLADAFIRANDQKYMVPPGIEPRTSHANCYTPSNFSYSSVAYHSRHSSPPTPPPLSSPPLFTGSDLFECCPLLVGQCLRCHCLTAAAPRKSAMSKI